MREVPGSRISSVLIHASRVVQRRAHSHRKEGAKTFRGQPQPLHNKDVRKFRTAGSSNSQGPPSASSRCKDRRTGKKDSKARTPHASRNGGVKGKSRNEAGIAMSNTS
jgi:hypothetical protein